MAEDINPVEFLPTHPPRTELEQLTDALAAGLITPELFALASEKLGHAGPPAPTSEPAPTAIEYPAGELPPLASFFEEPAPLAVAPAAPVANPTPLVAPGAAARKLVAAPASAALPPVPATASEVPSLVPPVLAPVGGSASDGYNELLGHSAPLPASTGRAVPLPAQEKSQPTWLKVGLVLIILGLLVLIYRQLAGSHPDEQLTSPRLPRSASAGPAVPAPARPSSRRTTHKHVAKSPLINMRTRSPKPAAPARAARAALAKKQVEKEAPARAAPAHLAASVPPASAGVPPEPMPQPIAAAPEAGDTEATTRVRAALAAYYADMLAPPFAAARHFAPHVERLYIQQNLTPADIETSFARSFFPDNQQAILQVVPGTLRVSPPVADGSRVATFVEASRLYRPSRRGYQRLRAQVRVRFNADYQIVYLRQERLLASEFE